MKKYLSFIKIEHTLFSLPVVFAGTLLALAADKIRSVSAAQLLWILLAAAAARAYGFGINRILDREIDARNPRTQEREIPSGAISLKAATVFTAANALLFLLAAGMLSKICLLMASVPLLLFSIYPLLKRWTPLAHLGLGAAWGIAPLGGWLAVSPQILPLKEIAPALLLAGFCVFWVAGFDVIYALLDEEFDRKEGLHSLPADFGRSDALRISELLHFAAFIFLGFLAERHLSSPLSFLFLAAAGLLFIVSHWQVRFRPLTPAMIDFAFFKVNAALGFVVFLLVAV